MNANNKVILSPKSMELWTILHKDESDDYDLLCTVVTRFSYKDNKWHSIMRLPKQAGETSVYATPYAKVARRKHDKLVEEIKSGKRKVE